MSKHFTGYSYDMTTFGMEIDASLARKALKKSFFKDFQIGEHSFRVRTYRCIKDVDVASVMGECAWLVIEKKAFDFVQLGEDSPKLKVIYTV